jgi:hypothetical protein
MLAAREVAVRVAKVGTILPAVGIMADKLRG